MTNVENQNNNIKTAAGVTAAVGLTYGTIAGLVFGPVVGAEVGLGFAGFTGGVAFGMRSADRAVELQKEGKRFRANLMALESGLEVALGCGIGGAVTGFALAGPEGAAWGWAIAGIILPWGALQVTMNRMSEAFRQRHQVGDIIPS